MNNNYEIPDAVELGEAGSQIRGMKDIGLSCEDVLGPNWIWLPNDVDESEE